MEGGGCGGREDTFGCNQGISGRHDREDIIAFVAEVDVIGDEVGGVGFGSGLSRFTVDGLSNDHVISWSVLDGVYLPSI